MNTHPDFSFSEDGRTATIFGVNYAVELFRHLGVGSIGSRIEIISRDDGVVTLRQLPAEWISCSVQMPQSNTFVVTWRAAAKTVEKAAWYEPDIDVKFWRAEHSDAERPMDAVTYWMPLPEDPE